MEGGTLREFTSAPEPQLQDRDTEPGKEDAKPEEQQAPFAQLAPTDTNEARPETSVEAPGKAGGPQEEMDDPNDVTQDQGGPFAETEEHGHGAEDLDGKVGEQGGGLYAPPEKMKYVAGELDALENTIRDVVSLQQAVQDLYRRVGHLGKGEKDRRRLLNGLKKEMEDCQKAKDHPKPDGHRAADGKSRLNECVQRMRRLFDEMDDILAKIKECRMKSGPEDADGRSEEPGHGTGGKGKQKGSPDPDDLAADADEGMAKPKNKGNGNKNKSKTTQPKPGPNSTRVRKAPKGVADVGREKVQKEKPSEAPKENANETPL